MRKPYPTDLSDDEWNYIEPHMPAPKGHGRPRIHSTREILNAIFYVLRSSCQWRMLPHDFPRWSTVYHYFRKWRIDGTWESINRALISEQVEEARIKTKKFTIPMSDEPGSYEEDQLRDLLLRYSSQDLVTAQRIRDVLLPACLERDRITREKLKQEFVTRRTFSTILRSVTSSP